VQIGRLTNPADPELFAARVQVPLENSCSCDKTSDGAGPRIMAQLTSTFCQRQDSIDFDNRGRGCIIEAALGTLS